MTLNARVYVRALGLLLVTLAWLPVQLAAQTGSAADLELLRKLPPEQREAVLNRVLNGGSSTRSTSSISSTYPTTIDPSVAQQLLRDSKASSQADNVPPVFQPEDYLVIEIDYNLPETAHAATPTNGNSAPVPTVPGQTVPPATTAAISVNGTRASADSLDVNTVPFEEQQRFDRIIQQVRAKNPYQLSKDGILYLPGMAGIPLAGLTEEKASLRLRSEPTLNRLDIRVTHMPIKVASGGALKPFGYDLFEQQAALFSASSAAPVPGSYIVGPGDLLEVQLYGAQNLVFSLPVARDGTVSFPELGPISVAGQRFENVKQQIESQVARQMIGVQASVSMGPVRGIQIFVVGEARTPGSYTVSGLATITSALYAAGGVTPIGSLRNIQLKRRGALVGTLDLYDVLLNGNTAGDVRLLDGDAIYIPPVGATVAVDGAVRRPAIYEVRTPQDIKSMVALAGGPTPDADTSKVILTRINEDRRRIVTETTLAAGTQQSVRDGDVLRLVRLHPALDSAVTLDGHAYSPGPFAWREGLRLSGVITSLDDLQPNADVHYVLIRRELPQERRIAVLSTDLSLALKEPGSRYDVSLLPRDRIIVFDKEAGRERVIGPLLEELRTQSKFDRPAEVVQIDGYIKAPGEYPLEPQMRISDLIRAGGSLEDAAFGGLAELTRYSIQAGKSRTTELIEIDLAAALRGEPQADLLLQSYDSLSIKRMPEWRARERIELLGEVRFPGFYDIKPGETLQSILERAGGVTQYAFPQGSVFTREELKKREQDQLNILADRLQTDMTSLALQGAAANQSQAGAALQVGQSLLTQLRTAKAIGRLVIDLDNVMTANGDLTRDIVLHDGDRLIVPKLRQEVMVLGEVQNSTAHLFKADLGREDYISLSGGITRKADSSKIYVVRADGSVVAREGNRWFKRDGRLVIQPGDTVVVPLDTERLPALPFWQSVTQILYNVAVAVAAVGSFN
jgi:polysaccharide biosynthesis/export protein